MRPLSLTVLSETEAALRAAGSSVEPPAWFTGVSLRMCSVCTAEPRRCQSETVWTFQSPHQKKNSIFGKSEIFFPLASGFYCGTVYIQRGKSLELMLYLLTGVWHIFYTVKYKILQAWSIHQKVAKHVIYFSFSTCDSMSYWKWEGKHTLCVHMCRWENPSHTHALSASSSWPLKSTCLVTEQ